MSNPVVNARDRHCERVAKLYPHYKMLKRSQQSLFLWLQLLLWLLLWLPLLLWLLLWPPLLLWLHELSQLVNAQL